MEEIYCNNCRWNHVKFESDGWGLCIRLYHEYTYIGCITNAWEDIKIFEIEV